MDFAALREAMLKDQLIPRGIHDHRLLDAMSRVPRHLFVNSSRQAEAYSDMALPTADGQTISQPYMVAIMTQLLKLQGNEKVLEIGTGSGYQSAILAELAAEVCSIERFEDLAQKAEERLKFLGYGNIKIRTGDGSLGWPEEAPFDRILVTAGTPEIPPPLIEQLLPGGIVVAPVGDRYSQQLLQLKKTSEGLEKQYYTYCVFVPLVGQYGWKE